MREPETENLGLTSVNQKLHVRGKTPKVYSNLTALYKFCLILFEEPYLLAHFSRREREKNGIRGSGRWGLRLRWEKEEETKGKKRERKQECNEVTERERK
ncbi:hypothetical protein EVAR_6831_1 [Eumeta japonica]|uniref:Uncharacterized protein n=1 Tax=Eumeta variegata TaxID=151549 RepID=A0A4C1U6C8_EUMVA|nr:hypothetical protein EVAR_6831_1 [Eumeta japonica]